MPPGRITRLRTALSQVESLHAQSHSAAATEVERLRQESQSEVAALQGQRFEKRSRRQSSAMRDCGIRSES